LLIGGLRCAADEQADKSVPQTADEVSADETDYAQYDKKNSES